jgi:hypothetical protein
MTEKELRKLSRADLLQMLIEQSEELRILQTRLQQAESLLNQREIALTKAGSIAEAALQLNGVFEAAQAACDQYMENIRRHSEQQEMICKRIEEEHRLKIHHQLKETQRKCALMEAETRRNCETMTRAARMESQAYWDEVSRKLDAYYSHHTDLKELLDRAFPRGGEQK